MKQCLFCAAPLTAETRSREHVFADWLLRYFAIQDYVVAPRIEEAGRVSCRRHPLGAFQLGGVCRDCNQGWMSDLERRSKPILIALHDHGQKISDLSYGEQTVIARWAVKTAAVLHAASGFAQRTIPLETYPALMKHPRRMPVGFDVFAFQSPDQADDILQVMAFQSMDWEVFVRGKPPTKRPAAIKTSLRIGDLHLLVAYNADPSWSIVSWRDVHLPVWPTRLGMTYELGLRHNLIRPRKESAAVLLNVSLMMAWGVSQDDIAQTDRPAIEARLEEAFKRLGGEVES